MFQCNNLISLKVTNDRDKSAVAAMLTDSLVGIVEMFPNLDVGESVVVGNAIMLPSKIILDKPKEKPKSARIDFLERTLKTLTLSLQENAEYFTTRSYLTLTFNI